MIPYRSKPVKPAEPVHEYSSLQINLPPKIAAAMQKIAAGIDKKDLKPEEAKAHSGPTADDGIEHESHVTARWGLHFMTPSARLRNALRDFGPITLTLGKTSLFTGGDADVLKIDVDSPDLHRLYALVERLVPVHTTFPVYRPHATIAYLRKGMGKKHVGNASLAGTKLRFDSVQFSGKRGHHEILPLGHPTPAPYRVR